MEVMVVSDPEVCCDRAGKLTSDVTKANTKILYTFCIRFRFVVLLAERRRWFSLSNGSGF
jgi:hypothetical protein